MESHQETVEAVEAGQQTISQILLGHDEPTPDQTHQEVGMISESSTTMALDAQDGTLHVQRVQAVTLHDGRTAFLDTSSIQGGKITPGQTLQLEDGTTAVVQAVAHEIKTHESITAEEQAQDKFTMEHSEIQLEDGTTAYIQNAPKEGLQAVHLEDGTAAYTLFPSDGQLDTTAGMSLQQLTDVSEAGDTTKGKGLEMLKTKLESSEKVFKCTFQGCSRTFPTQHHYKVHERSHSGDRPFKCEYLGCGKAFGVAYSLKSHYRVHTGEKPYKCPEKTCPKAFKTSGDLQKHVRTHTGERPFKCPFEGCGAAFTTSNIRKVHIRTHTGERPYVCPESGCGRSFASATNYKNHVRIHSGERPYVCTAEGCNKSFTEYSSLYKHHVVHTHSKPYACKHCGKNYRQTSTLSMHTRTVHAEVQAEYVPIQVIDQAALDKLPPLNKDQIEFIDAPGLAGASGDGLRSVGQVGGQDEIDSPLVINTADPQKQVTMVTPHGVSVVSNEQALVALQATQQAAQLAIQQIQQSSNDAGVQQIYVITDPSQLEIMQQHLSLQNQSENSVNLSASDSTQLQLAVCTQSDLPVSMTQISVADEVHYAVANTGGVDTLVEASSTVLTDHVHTDV